MGAHTGKSSGQCSEISCPVFKRETWNRLAYSMQVGYPKSLDQRFRLPWGTESLRSILSSSRSLGYLQYLMDLWQKDPKAAHPQLCRLLMISTPRRTRRASRRSTRRGTGAPGTEKTRTGAERPLPRSKDQWQ